MESRVYKSNRENNSSLLKIYLGSYIVSYEILINFYQGPGNQKLLLLILWTPGYPRTLHPRAPSHPLPPSSIMSHTRGEGPQYISATPLYPMTTHAYTASTYITQFSHRVDCLWCIYRCGHRINIYTLTK